MSSYNSNIPLPGDLLSKSQQDINNNFSSANTIMAINHYPFTEPSAKKGKHKFVELVNNAVIPAGLFSNEGTLYCKDTTTDTTNNEATLFYTPDLSGIEYQMTRTITPKNATFGSFVTNYLAGNGSGPVGTQFSGGWTFLPGGMLYQYGTLLVASLTFDSGSVLFPVEFTAATPSVRTIVITLTMISTGGGSSDNRTNSIQVGTVQNDLFKWSTPSGISGYQGFTWTALGV